MKELTLDFVNFLGGLSVKFGFKLILLQLKESANKV